ncbi:hypothetical protein DH2020_027156 [Rehmannia glutinosa]|uniref:Glabrous enhancer-binding protein-like DBD domain-containing protein n=1 Tax=Rehmannia glutinosa TaxID=99300 RepID=A0ABR0VXT1_REHGL
MAPKKLIFSKDDEQKKTESDDTSEGSEYVSESSEEERAVMTEKQNPTINSDEEEKAVVPEKQNPPNNSEEEDSYSDSESESEEDEVAPQPTKKPKINPPEKPFSNQSDSKIEKPMSTSHEKLSAESDFKSQEEENTAMSPSSSKKPKEGGSEDDGSQCSSPSESGFMIVPAAKPEEKKNSKFSKKFSDDDEIALLKGLAIFWADKGRCSMWAEFHHFIEDKLKHPFTKIQVSEKVRRLREKFEKNLARANAGCLEFSDPHQSLLFELSKPLWGDDKSTEGIQIGNEDEIDKNEFESGNIENDDEIDKESFESEFPLLYASVVDDPKCPKAMKDHIFRIGRQKALELEKKYQELKADELRLERKRIYLIQKHLLSK